MNVKFINLTTLPAWVDAKATKWNGLFVYVTEGADKGLYFGQDEWKKLSNVAQDTTAEIHSASIADDGTVSFFNSADGTGTALFTLGIADYVSGVADAKIQALDTTADVVIASVDEGVVTLKAGVKEVDGVIAQGDGADITLAKVATTGAAADVTLAAYEHPEGTVLIAEGTTVQGAIETIAAAVADDATAKVVKLYKKDADGKYTEVSSMAADGADYEMWQGATLKDGALTGGEKVFASNIEKDSFVKSGEVLYGSLAGDTFTAGTDENPGTAYLHLVIGTVDAAETNVYIAAADLVKQISGTANEVVVNNGVVSLAQAVKTSLGLADTAIQSVNGKTKTAENAGVIVLDADDIEYKAAVAESSVGAGDGQDAVSVKDAIDALNDNAYAGVENAATDQFVKVAEVADNKQTLSVELGEFDTDEDGNLKTDAAANGLKDDKDGLVKASEIGAIIVANEKVTAASLNDLDERVDALETANDALDATKVQLSDAYAQKTGDVAAEDTVETAIGKLDKKIDDLDESFTTVAGDTATALENTGVNVVVKVADGATAGSNDHDYTVSATAEMVWLTALPE